MPCFMCTCHVNILYQKNRKHFCASLDCSLHPLRGIQKMEAAYVDRKAHLKSVRIIAVRFGQKRAFCLHDIVKARLGKEVHVTPSNEL